MGIPINSHEKVGNDKAAAGSEARAAATYVENKSRSHGWKGKHGPQPMEKQGSRLKIKAGPRLRMKHEAMSWKEAKTIRTVPGLHETNYPNKNVDDLRSHMKPTINNKQLNKERHMQSNNNILLSTHSHSRHSLTCGGSCTAHEL
ncbi:hypothetical protein E3N88_04847 [Mikania micrantha]|uniref:Uncharacterized protein n=1 Tax=Mikania micrantha TaxID=192012 RepID=A0A5N6PVL0_9ASTR|nr:hypothetical protein E3N88_04847 [Mikania micrantha]